ncbi:MAG TPA: hypothetical protein VH134_13015 [Candidatus Dormibacteraeota bacterium]|jgi:hypothetical protein|nr:hypothetical protein [Candidatus Dormibacteraeota bacterium]
MARRRLTALTAGVGLAGLCLAGATFLAPAGALAENNPDLHTQATAAPPSVIAYSGSSAGIEFHLVPGQYHPTFDQAFVESFPYSQTSADSNPSASATAAPAELGLFLDNYPTAACLISTFTPYCDQIQKFPVDTYFARATSDSAKSHDVRTSFPCEPGAAQPKSVAIVPPSCSGSPALPLTLGDGAAHADATPDANAQAHLGAFELGTPTQSRAGYLARLRQARALLTYFHRPTAGVDRAMATAAIFDTAGITTVSAFHSGSDGIPRAHNQVVFGNLDALGGTIHADGLVLDLASATLGQARPPVRTEQARFIHLVVLGKDFGNVDSSNCNQVATQINSAAPSAVPGGQQFSLGAFGFRFSCSVTTSTVVTDPAKGFGLNPVIQELTGPGLDFAQLQNPLDYLQAAGFPIPQACYPNDKLPAPPALPAPPKPLPPPPGPTSTCQFLSTNSFANNGLSLHLGHVVQNLAAQPPVADSLGLIPGSADGAFGGGLTVGPPLTSEYPSRSSGTTGFGPSHAPGGLVPGAVAPVSGPPLVLAGVPYRDWLVFGYGAWGCAVLAALGLWALAIHRRRLGGVL